MRRLVRIYEIAYELDPNGALGYWLDRSWVSWVRVFGSDAVVDATGHVMSGTAAPAKSFSAPAQLFAPALAFARTLPASEQFALPERANGALPAIYGGLVANTPNLVQGFDASSLSIANHNPALPNASEVGKHAQYCAR